MTDGEMIKFGYLFSLGVLLALLTAMAGVALGVFLGMMFL